MNSTENASIWSQNQIQAGTRPIHNRLALQTKPQGNKDVEMPGMQINIKL